MSSMGANYSVSERQCINAMAPCINFTEKLTELILTTVTHSSYRDAWLGFELDRDIKAVTKLTALLW